MSFSVIETIIGYFSKEVAEKHQIFNYERYCELGGSICEDDFSDLITKAKEVSRLSESITRQAIAFAQKIGMDISEQNVDLGLITAVYVTLRGDKKPELKNHNAGKCDQWIFAETLRVFDRSDDLIKMYKRYPNICLD